MADKTNITWTDSTHHPWWGCTKIAPGCDNCYANALDKRTGGSHWGKGSIPRILSDNNWRKPHQWNRKAQNSGKPHNVFCGSMCDWADKNAPECQRDRLWNVIRETPYLRWQLLIKRAPNIKKYLPKDWGAGYSNVWLGVTVENRKNGLKRIDFLRDIPARIRFLSIEPLLEDIGLIDLTGIQWVIVGGESGPGARPMHTDWFESIEHQCREQNVPLFFKQWGSKGRQDKGGCLVNGVEHKQWPNTQKLTQAFEQHT